MIMRIVSLVLAFVLPPVAIWLMRGVSIGIWINIALCALALVVFWFVFAGPGVVLWALAGVQAVAVAVFMKRRGAGVAGEMT